MLQFLLSNSLAEELDTTLELGIDLSGDLHGEPEIAISAFGRNAIAVDQPVGGGSDFPFVGISELSSLVADLSYQPASSDEPSNLPYSIAWVYGLDEGSASVPFTPVHAQDMAITDSLGNTVFDSRAASAPVVQAWGDRLNIIQWKNNAGDVLRIAQHTAFSPDIEPVIYPIYIEPMSAVLDSRTHVVTTPRLKSLRLDVGDPLTTSFKLQNGYNTTLIPLNASGGTTIRPATVISLSATPASGAGRFDPGCDGEPILRRINNITADASGNVQLDADNCYRLERPVFAILDAALDTSALAIIDHTLQVFNDCGPCCTCDNFVNTYEGVRKMRDRYANLSARATAVRDLYAKNVARFASQKSCRDNQTLRVAVTPICPDILQMTVGFCNSTDACMENVVLFMSFEYNDGTTVANTIFSGESTPTAICDSTFRGGNVDANPTSGFNTAAPKLYALGGSYPHYYSVWDKINPGALASLSVQFLFQDSAPADRVDVAFDVYQAGHHPTVVNPTPGVAVSPIAGYTLGVGPTTVGARAARVVSGVRKVSTGLLQSPCCGEES